MRLKDFTINSASLKKTTLRRSCNVVLVLTNTWFIKDTLFDPQPHLELRPMVHRRFNSKARLASVA